MAGRPRSVDDEAIFDSIAQVVSSHGPVGLTLAAVASHVGVTPPALMQRFGSKRGLLSAFAAHQSRDVDNLVAGVLQTHTSPCGAVIAVLTELAGPVSTRTAMANNLAFLHMDLSDDEFGQHAARQSRTIRGHLLELVQQAIATGELATSDPSALADLLHTTYNGALVTWAIAGDGPLMEWLTVRLNHVLQLHRPEDVA